MIAIFDIGANNGLNGLAFAILNPNTKVFSFEPNPLLRKTILKNKKIFEKKLRINLKNFFFIEKAVSNKKEKTFFYITENDATSSLLKPKKKLNKFWTQNKDTSIKNISNWIRVKKIIRIETIKLKDFCNDNKISKIAYMHCDTQGNDLKVFEGLGNYRMVVKKGVLESAIKPELSLYNKSTTLKKIKKSFIKWGYKIESVHEFHKNNPERNIYFSNKNFRENIKFNSPTQKNLRLFNRILKGKTKFKDNFFIYILRKNLILNYSL